MPLAAYRDNLAYVGAIGILVFVYYVTAKFGLSLAYIHSSATTIWAPTGVSLVALLLFGFRYWPGIFIGAFLANITTEGTILTSLGIAGGNTLEAVVGTYLIQQFASGANAFTRSSTVWAFIICISLAATVSATLGVISLSLAQLVPLGQFNLVWVTWWLGNVGGALLIPPFVITWWNNFKVNWTLFQCFEIISIIVGTFVTAYIVFGPINFALGFFVVPVLLWVVMRFTIREVASITLLLSALAIGGTLQGFGPYASSLVESALLYLQAFVIVCAACTLVLSAIVTERREAQIGLENADQAKDDFLTALSHELRNPIASIVSHVQLLEFENPSEIEAKLLNNIRLELRHTTELLEDLLDLSRIRRGRMGLNKEHFDLCILVREVCDNFAPIVREAGHTLERRFEDRPHWIYGDRVRIKQILINLLSNASKYTDRGGIITIACHALHRRAVVSINDTGAGITPERLSTLINGGGARTTHPRAGLGIGLMLVKRLIDMHHATLEVESEGEGKGSTFTISFPLIAPENIPSTITAQHQSLFSHIDREAGHRRTVLVVDDNKKAAEALVRLLQKLGHTAHALYEGGSVLRYLAENPVDLVILDIALPDISGHELAKQIGEAMPDRRPILVALSGYGTEDDISHSRAVGFARHLVKPVDMKELEELLK